MTTSNLARAGILERALRAGVEGDDDAMRQLCTEDVKAWAPATSADGVNELAAEVARRDDAFSDIELEVRPLDVGGDYACAEWCVSMTHTGKLVLADAVVEPTGVRLTLNGISVAEFADDRICAIRQYWDELAVFQQLGVLSEPP